MRNSICLMAFVSMLSLSASAQLGGFGGLGNSGGGLGGIGGQIGDIISGGLGKIGGEVNSYGQTYTGVGAGVGHTAEECLVDAKTKAEAAAIQTCQSGSVVTGCVLSGQSTTTKSPSKIADFTAYAREDVQGENAAQCQTQVIGKAERAALEQCQTATNEPCSITASGKVTETSTYKQGGFFGAGAKKWTMCKAVASAGPADRNKLICEVKAQAKKQGLVKP